MGAPTCCCCCWPTGVEQPTDGVSGLSSEKLFMRKLNRFLCGL